MWQSYLLSCAFGQLNIETIKIVPKYNQCFLGFDWKLVRGILEALFPWGLSSNSCTVEFKVHKMKKRSHISNSGLFRLLRLTPPPTPWSTARGSLLSARMKRALSIPSDRTTLTGAASSSPRTRRWLSSLCATQVSSRRSAWSPLVEFSSTDLPRQEKLSWLALSPTRLEPSSFSSTDPRSCPSSLENPSQTWGKRSRRLRRTAIIFIDELDSIPPMEDI